MLYHEPPSADEKYLRVLLHEYFNALRMLCHDREIAAFGDERSEVGETILNNLMAYVVKNLPAKSVPKAFQDMQARFVHVLAEHDEPWLWDLYAKLNAKLPPALLH